MLRVVKDFAVSLKVVQGHTDEEGVCNVLLVIHCRIGGLVGGLA